MFTRRKIRASHFQHNSKKTTAEKHCEICNHFIRSGSTAHYMNQSLIKKLNVLATRYRDVYDVYLEKNISNT